MITNATINSKTRTFTETETKQPHVCTKETIEWDKLPDLTESSDNIIWYGKCAVCGREVEELYTQEPELYDSKTHEEIERPIL